MNDITKAVVSVLGTDRKGIIAKVTGTLFDNGANVLDISQTIVSGLFSMILIADITGCSFDVLKAQLDALGEELGVQIRMQRNDIFEAMYRI